MKPLEPIVLPPSEKTSDRYMTTDVVLGPISTVWPLGIDVDAFHDPESDVVAHYTVDIRKGGNAYTDHLPMHRLFANGPYSGKYPQATADLCMRYRARGGEFFNLCPAAVGSQYWRERVWPWADAVVWLGRIGFRAAVDIMGKDDRVICPAGETQNGNRTEIALVYGGDEPDRVRDAFSSTAHTTIVTR